MKKWIKIISAGCVPFLSLWVGFHLCAFIPFDDYARYMIPFVTTMGGTWVVLLFVSVSTIVDNLYQ